MFKKKFDYVSRKILSNNLIEKKPEEIKICQLMISNQIKIFSLVSDFLGEIKILILKSVTVEN